MIPDELVWTVWATAFVVPWTGLFLAFPRHRVRMVLSSVFTAPLGLSEPLFVPDYWNPPGLFDLARTTGFDVESLVFSFAIGGIGSVLYDVLTARTPSPVPAADRRARLHRWHPIALVAPILTFPLLYVLPWNPIYAAISAMAAGSVAAVLCRPDLGRKTWVGGLLFMGFYTVFLQGVRATAPGYVERVWNLDALSGVLVAGMPIEELLFALAFGSYWSALYEHITWTRPVPVALLGIRLVLSLLFARD